VGFTSSVIIVFQAASAFGATPAPTTSWIWALGLGMGLTSAGLSLAYRQPVLTAWSTPGAALLVTAGAGVPMSEATGAFVVCAALIVAVGASGLFARVMDRIPRPLAAALLAGVLVRFAFDAFVSIQRTAGYQTPLSPVITVTGIATLPSAPFGAFALNLAAVTAAICMGREAHEDPAKRYMAAVMAGLFYIALGLMADAVVGLIAAFARPLVLAVAGFVLLGTIGSALAATTKEDKTREAALVTFVVSASGLTLAGVGAAFWGVVAGALALAVQHWRPFR